MITLDDLKAICPLAKSERLELFVEPLNAAMAEFEINNPARECAFLAQVAHESGCFQWMREIWGPTLEQNNYELPSHKAAELGNTDAGDGFKYRGRGLIQTTGRANYRLAGEALGLPLEDNPALLEEPVNAARSAGYFWKSHGLNELADKGDMLSITRRINGGLNGYKERYAYFERAQGVLA